MDSNAGHLNNRPVHDMVLLLLPSGGNWNYTGWLADRLHWLLLTAALCNGWLADRLHWLLLTATLCNGWLADRLHWLLLTDALCNGCCCLQLLPSTMAGCYLQWLLLSATTALCNGCCYLQWLLLSEMAAASGSSGYTGVYVEVLDLLLVFQLKCVKLQIVPIAVVTAPISVV